MKTAWLVLALLVAGCGKDGGKFESFEGTPYSIISNKNLKIQTVMTGEGSVGFRDPLPEGTESAVNFQLDFQLDPDGTLSLISNASPELVGGISLQFRRQGRSLLAYLRTERGMVDISAKFVGIDASERQLLLVDMHNDEPQTHVLVWNGRAADADPFFNSQKDRGMRSPGKGLGQNWGVEIQGATLYGVPKISGAKNGD